MVAWEAGGGCSDGSGAVVMGAGAYPYFAVLFYPCQIPPYRSALFLFPSKPFRFSFVPLPFSKAP